MTRAQQHMVLAFLLAVWINAPYWWKTIGLMRQQEAWQLSFLGSQILFVFGVTLSLFFLLPTKRFIYVLIFTIAALCSYFSFTYQVYIDRSMLVNLIRTDYHEAKGLLSSSLVLWMCVFLLPCGLYLKRLSPKTGASLKFRHRILFSLFAFSFALLVSFPIYKNYASFYRINNNQYKILAPYNLLVATFEYAKRQYNVQRTHVPVAVDAKRSASALTPSTLWVLVIGETARADRFSLNGYSRLTNPTLSQLPNLVSFSKAVSCGTVTAYSVPCLLSDLSAKKFNPDEAPYRDNILDILKRVGVQVDWLDNQSGCQGTCAAVSYLRLPQDCPEKLCFDVQLVEALKNKLQENPSQDQLIVLHMNGSHGPAYYQRYPKEYEQFAPACITNAIEKCSVEELNNVYDNTIFYTDAVLGAIIEQLSHESHRSSAMLYLSDHGESLGENGWYLHGAPYRIAPKEQTHIPFIFWANTEFYQRSTLNWGCLKERADATNISQDAVFHTLLAGFSVQTSSYDPNLDALEPCRQKKHESITH